MTSPVVNNLLIGFVVLYSIYVVIFLLNPDYANSTYNVNVPSGVFNGASGELFRLLMQYLGLDCLGLAVFAYLAAQWKLTASARAFFMVSLVWAFAMFAFVVVRGQLNWTVKHHGDMNGVYLNVGQFVAIIAASAFGLLNLRSDDEEGEQKQQTSTNTNLYVGILTFVSGLFGVLFLFFTEHVATAYRVDKGGHIFSGVQGELVRLEMEFLGATNLAFFTLGVLAYLSHYASVKQLFFITGLVISVIGTPAILLGPHRNWVVKHSSNDHLGLYIALILNFSLFATQLLGLMSVSNDAKRIKTE